MFAINGPSGPTTRCERRVVTPAEHQQLELMRKQLAKQKSESFFTVRPPSSRATASVSRKAKAPRGADAKTARTAASKTAASADITHRDEPSPSSAKQDKPERSSSGPSQIFKGCRILFNGRTGNISSYYLAKLVQDHGGNVCSALTTTRVTHVVGANLSGSKADKVLKTLGKAKVVSPEWLLQSVKLRKRQAEFDYLLYKDTRQLRIR